MKLLLILILLPLTVHSTSVSIISKNIKKLKRMKTSHSKILARSILKYSKKYEIDYRIILAILKVESNFEQSGMNRYKCDKKNKECGDYSIAQINYRIWKKKLKLDLQKLKSKNSYAILNMAKILKIVKSKKDPLWFLKYHSKTSLYKLRYLRMLEPALAKLKYPLDYKKKESLLRKAVQYHGWKAVMAIFTKIPSVKKLIDYSK